MSDHNDHHRRNGNENAPYHEHDNGHGKDLDTAYESGQDAVGRNLTNLDMDSGATEDKVENRGDENKDKGSKDSSTPRGRRTEDIYNSNYTRGKDRFCLTGGRR